MELIVGGSYLAYKALKTGRKVKKILQGDIDAAPAEVLASYIPGLGDIDDLGEIDHVTIEYELKQLEIKTSTPEVIASQTIENNSNVAQSTVFKFNETRTATSTFTRTHGFNIKAGVKVNAGIPLVAGGSVTVDVSTSHTFSYGDVISTSRSFSYEFPLNVGPHSSVRSTANVSKIKAAIPFIATIHFKCSNDTERVLGMWEGIDFVDTKTKFETTLLEGSKENYENEPVIYPTSSENDWQEILNMTDDAEDSEPPLLTKSEATQIHKLIIQKDVEVLGIFRAYQSIANPKKRLKRFARALTRLL